MKSETSMGKGKQNSDYAWGQRAELRSCRWVENVEHNDEKKTGSSHPTGLRTESELS